MKKQKGFYWHVHHDTLCEWCYNYQERVDYIKKNKPKHEVKTRLRLFNPVKNVKLIPKEFAEAEIKRDEALDKFAEAEIKYPEAVKKYEEACMKYEEAVKKYEEAWKKCAPQLEKLHKKECGCSEWNGEEIVIKGEEVITKKEVAKVIALSKKKVFKKNALATEDIYYNMGIDFFEKELKKRLLGK